MSRVNVEIELPDTLATQAKKAGLLEPKHLNGWCARRCSPREPYRVVVGVVGDGMIAGTTMAVRAA